MCLISLCVSHPDITMTQNQVLNSTWEVLQGGLNSSSQRENPLTHHNITYVDFYLHKPSVAAVFTISYLLIFVVCMGGNGVVCFIVLRSRSMRTVTNVFILNLAISDLLVGIFCMPTTLVDNIITGRKITLFFLNSKYIHCSRVIIYIYIYNKKTIQHLPQGFVFYCRMAIW